jgi:hypothetical protein
VKARLVSIGFDSNINLLYLLNTHKSKQLGTMEHVTHFVLHIEPVFTGPCVKCFAICFAAALYVGVLKLPSLSDLLSCKKLMSS